MEQSLGHFAVVPSFVKPILKRLGCELRGPLFRVYFLDVEVVWDTVFGEAFSQLFI